MNARVAFKSASFPKYQDEDAETINAHLGGKRLAEYLRDQLPNHGVATAGILCEDFGWIVEIEHEPFPFSSAVVSSMTKMTATTRMKQTMLVVVVKRRSSRRHPGRSLPTGRLR